MRGLFLLAMVLAGQASAHPHSQTDQQVALTLTGQGTDVIVTIAPSPTDGPEVLRLIDTDGNGAISDAEAEDFGRSVIASARWHADGLELPVTFDAIRMADAQQIEAGLAPVVITASADQPGNARVVEFSMYYDVLSTTWFIQPWIATTAAAPRIDRTENGATLTLTFSENG